MTDTQNTNSFVAQLESDSEKYKDSAAQEQYCAQVREQAAEHFLNELLSGDSAVKQFEELTVHRNKLGQQTVRLTQWQGRGPTHLDQSLSDLLDIGDLLQRMQDHLDATYGQGTFRVFNHRVRGSRNRTVSLTVSWNKEKFENVDSIIENNRQRALERVQRQQESRGDMDMDMDGDGDGDGDAEDDLAPRNRGPPRRREGDHREGGRYEDRPRRREGGREGGRYEDRPRRRYDERSYDERPRRPERYDDSAPRRRPAGRGDGPTRDSAPRDSAPHDSVPRGDGSARPSRRRAAVASYDN